MDGAGECSKLLFGFTSRPGLGRKEPGLVLVAQSQPNPCFVAVGLTAGLQHPHRHVVQIDQRGLPDFGRQCGHHGLRVLGRAWP
ncbi:MAG: hypothetical protein ACJATT_001762 [Myxococcota bacterium]